MMKEKLRYVLPVCLLLAFGWIRLPYETRLTQQHQGPKAAQRREEPELPETLAQAQVQLHGPKLRYVLPVCLLLAFGWIRLPYETRLTQQHQEADFGTVKLNLSLRERLGQLGFLAALSGFRTLVADLLWIEAHSAWERVEYGRMNLLLTTVTTLAPKNANFWDLAAWHMAYNASVAVMQDRKQPKIAIKLRAQHEYFILGKNYAERGIANNPQKYILYQTLGNIYKYKLDDQWNAFLAYDRGAACPDAPSYLKRLAVYALSDSPGHEREAWQRVRKLYDLGPQERLPTLEKDLQRLEEKLQLPAEQRVYKTP